MCSGCSDSAQALLKLSCSPSARIKAAAAHVRRLKWNQRKKKLILSLWVLEIEGDEISYVSFARVFVGKSQYDCEAVGIQVGISLGHRRRRRSSGRIKCVRVVFTSPHSFKFGPKLSGQWYTELQLLKFVDLCDCFSGPVASWDECRRFSKARLGKNVVQQPIKQHCVTAVCRDELGIHLPSYSSRLLVAVCEHHSNA